MADLHAYCWATGKIEFGYRVPEGALTIASGPESTLKREIEVKARHAYDSDVLLVPGVPEADNQYAAMTALIAWVEWAKPSWEAAGLTVSAKEGL
ncbi:MAG: host nuclease inhibitor protein [Rhodospirillaceae bacterium]|nr:host nuclease inhibitor protein [Rhodospirillaceae bacterium]